MTTSMVEVKAVSKRFAGVAAVDRADFVLERGKFLTILGPSGCGKTTLLRMIAGFLKPDEGHIAINGQEVEKVPPHRRSIGMVFQKLALFPHMTAADNVAYPLKMRAFDKAGIGERVERYLSIVRLDGLGERRPHELSGGQQQRVAIARALVFDPDLLLLDEPLSALDRKLREEMQLEFRRIQQELGVTTINVTHDQREALVMSDQIVVMKDGIIQQAEDPVSMYRSPENRFVAGFIGLTSFFSGRFEKGFVQIASLALNVGAKSGLNDGDKVDCAIRAEQVRICATPGFFDNEVKAIVVQRIFEGDRFVYELRVPGLGDALIYAFEHDPTYEKLHETESSVLLGWNAADILTFKT